MVEPSASEAADGRRRPGQPALPAYTLDAEATLTPQQAEAAIQQHDTDVERLLAERTAALQATNARLQAEITARQHAERLVTDYSYQLEREVARRTHELQAKNTQLEETLQRLQDIQTQVIMQQKLASLGALTAGIAHEIRNPLNFVNNFADLSVELGQELRDELRKHAALFDTEAFADLEDIVMSLDQNMQKIIEHGKRADRIVTGMLQHSRGQAGGREPTDLNALLGEYLTLAYHGLRAQDTSFNVTIHTAYDPSIGMAEVVPQDIGRVFLNLINNAFYAVHAQHKALGKTFVPTVRVRTANRGGQIEVGIYDNGAGIPAEIQDKIFQPFFTTKPAGSGTGLGLSMSYDIVVHAHQGQITFCTRVGEGTEFTLLLPKQPGGSRDTRAA
jgi:signal transduction histidine kinase